MAISVRKIYEEVCDCLLEPGQLTGEIVTDEIFLRLLNDSIRNAFQVSDCFIDITNLVSEMGVRVYSHPYYINQPQVVLSDESNLFQGSGHYWDNSDYRWQQLGDGTPQEWRSDQLQEDQIEVRPSPAWNGYQVEIPGGFYGAFSETSSPVTFDIEYDPASPEMYGTIAKADLGSVYVEFTAPMYGVPASIVESTLNITEFSTYTPDKEIESLDDYIPDLPDSFKPYLKFAVLSQIFSMDGESKNDYLAKYYKKRTEELVSILRSVSGEILLPSPQ